MPHAPSRPAGAPKQLVQVRLNDDESQLVDAFAEALSRQSYGAQFSRPEVLKLAALEWLRTHQVEALPPAVMPERQPSPPAPCEAGVPVAPVTLTPVTGATQSPALPTAEGAPSTKPLSPKQQAVVQYILEHGNGPVTAEALQTGLGWKQQAIPVTLWHMTRAGVLVAMGDGRYTLPATSDALDLA